MSDWFTPKPGRSASWVCWLVSEWCLQACSGEQANGLFLESLGRTSLIASIHQSSYLMPWKKKRGDSVHGQSLFFSSRWGHQMMFREAIPCWPTILFDLRFGDYSGGELWILDEASLPILFEKYGGFTWAFLCRFSDCNVGSLAALSWHHVFIFSCVQSSFQENGTHFKKITESLQGYQHLLGKASGSRSWCAWWA